MEKTNMVEDGYVEAMRAEVVGHGHTLMRMYHSECELARFLAKVALACADMTTLDLLLELGEEGVHDL